MESTDAAQGYTLQFETCGRTDTGQRRPHNEDSIEVSDSLRLYAVADGMGGHAAGEVASRTAVQTLREFVARATSDPNFTWPYGMKSELSFTENILLTGIHLANNRVCQVAGENVEYSGMGTTLAAIIFNEGQAFIGHVGDSRVYRLREGQLEPLTRDHSWVNEQVQRKIITEAEARNHRWRNVITRALGSRVELEIDLRRDHPQAGDLYLLCTDGLTSMMTDEEIQGVLSRSNPELEDICGELIEAANRAGGADNISVVLVRVQG